MFKSLKGKIVLINLIVVGTIMTIFVGLLFVSYNYNEEQVINETSPQYLVRGRVTQNTINIEEFSNLKEFTQQKSQEIAKKILRNVVPIGIFIFIVTVGISLIAYKYVFLNKKSSAKMQEEFSSSEGFPSIEGFSSIEEFSDFENTITKQEKDLQDNIDRINNINQFIAHEMKNSLAVLQGKLLVNPEEALDYSDKLVTQVDDIRALTTQKLVRIGVVDLLLVCAECVDNFQGQNINLTFTEDDFYVEGNKNLLERAISNIMENAFKYGAQKIELDLSREYGNIILKISNDGPEIPGHEVDNIFAFSYQLKTSKKDGNGIGLALVQNVMELHKGSIFLESSEKKTTFILSFKAKS